MLGAVSELNGVRLRRLLGLPDGHQSAARVDYPICNLRIVLVNISECNLIGLLLNVDFFLLRQVFDDLLVSDSLGVERELFEVALRGKLYLDSV